MKKGLSKLLSLACVFALLMTMAIPAFATPADKVVVITAAKLLNAVGTDFSQYVTGLTNDDLETAVKAVATDETTKFNKWLLDEKDGPYFVDVVEGDKADGTVDIWGVFVCTGQRVRLHLFDMVPVKAGADADAKKAALEVSLQKGYAKGWAHIYSVVKNHAASQVSYYFDDQGYLAVGTKDGALLVRNIAGEYDQYLIGFNAGPAIDKDTYDEKNTAAPAYGVYHRDYALVAPYVFCVFDESVGSVGAVAGKTYYGKDGKAPEGLTGFNKTQPEYYQTRKNNTYIEMEAGLQEVPIQHYDSYAGAEVKNTLRVYGWPKAGVKEARGSQQVLTGKVATNYNGAALNYEGFDSDWAEFTYARGYEKDGSLVDVSLSAGADPVTYLVENGTSVRTNDGTTAKNLISFGDGGKIYLINSDGTVYKNPNTIQGIKQADSNVYKYDGYLREWGEEKVVSLNGVDQKFYVPAAKEGQQSGGTYDGFRVATNYYRYVPAKDTSEAYEGITYYNSVGNSYLGWMSQTDKSFAKGRMYQTHIKESDTYIIVAGPQYLEAGVNPTDTTKTIDAGWYLFDKDGVQVQGTGSFYKFGKTFVLKNDVIQTVDGQLITFENCAVDLTK